MNICFVHGSNRKGNTDKTIEIMKKNLSELAISDNSSIEFSDVYLPKDLPDFCKGCFNCLSLGDFAGEKCPHRKYTQAILDKFFKSDGIVITSPSYALSESAQVKNLLDHFAAMYTNHRPFDVMFDKIGLVVSTAAGAGTRRVCSTISRSMLFWGMKRRLTCRINIWAKDWNDMEDKKRLKAENKLFKKSKKFYNLTKNRKNCRSSCITLILPKIWKNLIKSYDDSEPDKIYWLSKGWL